MMYCFLTHGVKELTARYIIARIMTKPVVLTGYYVEIRIQTPVEYVIMSRPYGGIKLCCDPSVRLSVAQHGAF